MIHFPITHQFRTEDEERALSGLLPFLRRLVEESAAEGHPHALKFRGQMLELAVEDFAGPHTAPLPTMGRHFACLRARSVPTRMCFSYNTPAVVRASQPASNVEIVERLFNAWNDGTLEDVLPYVAEGIEWLEVEAVPMGTVPASRRSDEAGTEVQGKAEVRSMLESLYETWEHYRLNPERIQGIDEERVLAVLREEARGRASGVEVAGRWGYVFTFRHDEVARVEAYRNPADAIGAVGLLE